MKVSVFGLGYVGAVSTACLARDGRTVIGVDVNPEKVRIVGSGKAPIMELGLTELLAAGVHSGLISATTDCEQAIRDTDVSLITVGTPNKPNGELDLSAVTGVCEEIGLAVQRKKSMHSVIIRSTVPAGTMRACRRILEELAGDTPIHVACNPEFLREGSAIRDYDSPAFTIIGTEDPVAEKVVRELYAGVDAPFLVLAPEEAEVIKAVANAWHATKITFANEIGRLSKSLGVDGRAVMNVIKEDTKLNVSKAYMSPGFAYGGSCLPKDVRGLLSQAAAAQVDLPLLQSLENSNTRHIDAAEQMVRATNRSPVGIVGLAFKPGTDDLRESPAVELVQRLLARGLDIVVFDEDVYAATLMGANKQFTETHLPRLPDLLIADPETFREKAGVLVFTHTTPKLRSMIRPRNGSIPIIDLAGLFSAPPGNGEYEGSGW